MSKDPIIIALSGNKGGGKNTLSSFIVDYYEDRTGFAYPEAPCQEFAFADTLKEFCINVLGLEHSQCYGSDEEKNTLTKYKWEDTPHFNLGWDEDRVYMTGRDVMQIFGTESVRAWFGNVWADATMRKISQSLPLGLALVTDNRFPNEVEAVLSQPKGYIIRLTRSPYAGSDMHSSETALDDFDWDRPKCFILDNAHMTKDEQNQAASVIVNTIFQEK
jgi:hypothetical protein